MKLACFTQNVLLSYEKLACLSFKLQIQVRSTASAAVKKLKIVLFFSGENRSTA